MAIESMSIKHCLVVHPTARKWVITPIISGLTRSLSHVNHWGYSPFTKWDEPPSGQYFINGHGKSIDCLEKHGWEILKKNWNKEWKTCRTTLW